MWVGAAAGLALALSMFLNNNGPRGQATAVKPGTGNLRISGEVLLADSASFTKVDGGGCAGSGVYADVVEGASVVITTTGAVAGATLTGSRAAADGSCRFSFSVSEVPTGQDAYLVMIADQDLHQYAESELTGALTSLRLD
jgi:hypothetical protein